MECLETGESGISLPNVQGSDGLSEGEMCSDGGMERTIFCVEIVNAARLCVSYLVLGLPSDVLLKLYSNVHELRSEW